ncbi:MAG: ion transporter [Prolixibacteraceae bacterium]
MAPFKKRLYEIVFEADTRAGRMFDIVLLVIILVSVLVVMLESVAGINAEHRSLLTITEWIITGIFTLEYFTRIRISRRPLKYIFSFYGLIDLLAVIPTYLGLILTGGHSLIVIRALRLIRVFRILKLTSYTSAGNLIADALWESRQKLGIFVTFVLILTVIIGTFMYTVEGHENGFIDIPTSIYWAIVTLTTVGYGDISPATGVGKFFASLVMILGYAIIAVPTGIVTASLMRKKTATNTQVCSNCLYDKHDDDARYCKRCGSAIY